MSCRNCKHNEKWKDINHVRILAKQCANILQQDQIIYKIEIYGVTHFRFSEDWKGKVIEIIRFDREPSSRDILQDSKQREGNKSVNLEKSKTKEDKPREIDGCLDGHKGAVLQGKQSKNISKSSKKTKKTNSSKK